MGVAEMSLQPSVVHAAYRQKFGTHNAMYIQMGTGAPLPTPPTLGDEHAGQTCSKSYHVWMLHGSQQRHLISDLLS